MFHSLYARFLMAFLAVAFVAMALLGQITLELWERDRAVLTREAKARAETQVRGLVEKLKTYHAAEDELDALAAERWLDVVAVGRAYPEARAWLAARPWVQHLAIFDAGGNLVWTDAPLVEIRKDPWHGDELPSLLTSLLSNKHVASDMYAWMMPENRETRADGVRLVVSKVEGDNVRVEYPAMRPTPEAPNWMKDPSWAELGKTGHVTPRSAVTEKQDWYRSRYMEAAGVAIMRGDRRIGHLRLFRAPLENLLHTARYLQRLQGETGVELAALIQRGTEDGMERAEAHATERTSTYPLAHPPAPDQLPWSRDPKARRSVKFVSSPRVPWDRLLGADFAYEAANQRAWYPKPGVVQRETSEWLCAGLGFPWMGAFEGYVAVALPMSAVLAPVEERQNELARAFGFVLGCAILTAMLLARWVTRPIATLTAAARAVSETGTAPAVDPGRTDEIGVLARAFNEMAQRVEGRMLEANRALADRNDRLEKLNRVKSDFFAGLSHDLKTPLARIRGSAEVIAMESRNMGQDIAQVLDSITGNVDLVSSLVDKILAVSQLENEKPSLELARVSLGTLVQRVSDRHAPEIARRGLTLAISTDDAKDRVHVDEGRIEQVVANLLENAVKYSPPGSPLAIAIADAGDFVEMRLSDRGPGLTADERERVFEKFYRAARPGLRQVPGIGLGLYMARMLTELHAGYLRAESPGVDQGSCFVLGLRREV
jgi:signal transduction histidine kinase